jgi:(E)-4-hydroxy-3-methylbut-2-enyl-diphosphate synthase
MGDANFGYVGAGPGKVNLYRRDQCVKTNIPEANAVEELLKLIESYKKN